MRKLATYNEMLQCKLTDEEVHAERTRACQLLDELDRLDEQRAEALAKLKADAQKRRVELLDARSNAERRWVLRDIPVERWVDDHGEVTEIRLDTKEVILRRNATASERQDPLNLAQPTPRPPTPPGQPEQPKPGEPQPPQPQPTPDRKDDNPTESPTLPGVPNPTGQRTSSRRKVAAPVEGTW